MNASISCWDMIVRVIRYAGIPISITLAIISLQLLVITGLILLTLALFNPAEAGVLERTEKQYDLQRQAYARSIEEVMRITTNWILANPGDPNNPSQPLPAGWADRIPFEDRIITSLHPSVVLPGIKARYCDSTLLVYLDAPNQKGIAPTVGNGPGDLRLIQTARVKAHIQSNRRNAPGRPDPLQWLEGGQVAEGISVPDCMSTGLPSGRPALIEHVTDPATRGSDIQRIETKTTACPRGQHGRAGIIQYRTGIRRYNGKRGGWQGDTVWNDNWEVKFSSCKEDYTETETVKWDCAPHNPEKPWLANYGERTKKFTAGSHRIQEDIAANRFPVLVRISAYRATRSTCPGVPPGTIPDLPTPTDINTRETRSSGCPSGYTGSTTLSRTKTVRTTTLSWNQDPVTTILYSNWSQTANSCRKPPLICHTVTYSNSHDDHRYCYCSRGSQRFARTQGSCRSRGGRSSGGNNDRDDPTHDADRDGVGRDTDFDDNDASVGAGGRSNE